MLSLNYTNETTWSPPPSPPPPSLPPCPPPLEPPSRPPLLPPPPPPLNATDNETTSSTNGSGGNVSGNATTNGTNASNATAGGAAEGLSPRTANQSNATNRTNGSGNESEGFAAVADALDAGPTDPGPLYALVGNLTAEVRNGVATFTDLRVTFRRFYLGVLGPTAGVFRLITRLSSGGGGHLRPGYSSNFSILLPTVPYALSFAVQPSPQVQSRARLQQPPVVSVVGVGGAQLATSVSVALRAIATGLEPGRSAAGGGGEGEGGGGGGGGAGGARTPMADGEGDGSISEDADLLGGLEGSRSTTDQGNLSYDAMQFTTTGVFALEASSEGLLPAVSRAVAVIPAPALLPCDPATCQWAAAAVSGRGRLPPAAGLDALAMPAAAAATPPGAQQAADESPTEDADAARYLGRPELSLGPPDMIGCGLANEGKVWEPRGSSGGRWLLVRFASPAYATGVAVCTLHHAPKSKLEPTSVSRPLPAPCSLLPAVCARPPTRRASQVLLTCSLLPCSLLPQGTPRLHPCRRPPPLAVYDSRGYLPAYPHACMRACMHTYVRTYIAAADESRGYGNVQQLRMIDETGVSYVLVDRADGDVDDADCVQRPLARTFPPTQRRIVGVWILVAPSPSESDNLAATTGSGQPPSALGLTSLVQIDAVQLLSTPSPTGSGAPLRAFVATRGAARLDNGAVTLADPEALAAPPGAAAVSGGLALHLPSAFALRSRRRGGHVLVGRTRFISVSFTFRLGASGGDLGRNDPGGGGQGGSSGGGRASRGVGGSERAGSSDVLPDLDGVLDGDARLVSSLAFCYGEAPAAGAMGVHGMANGLCVFVRPLRRAASDAPAEQMALIEVRYDDELLRGRMRPSGSMGASPEWMAPSPECDGMTVDEDTASMDPYKKIYDPPQCAPLRPIVPPPLRAWRPAANATWQSISLRVLSSGLTLEYGGEALFERAPIPTGWDPKEHWSFSFGARSEGDGAAHGRTTPPPRRDQRPAISVRVANVSIARGAAVESAAVGLALAINGQQYTQAGTYVYHAHPAISSLAPTHGPAAGGTALTLRGMALGGAEAYSCRFALGLDPPLETAGAFDTAVDGVICRAPTRAAMAELAAEWAPDRQAAYVPNATHEPHFDVYLRLWREGFEYRPRTRSSYRLNLAPRLERLLPTSGPVLGGTVLHVLGQSLGGGWRYTCRFSAAEPIAPPAAPRAVGPQLVTRTVPASYAEALAGVRCVSPRSVLLLRSEVHADLDGHGAAAVQLHVSLNAADYEEGAENASIPFAFYSVPTDLSLSPSSGPHLGGTPITISGVALDGGTERRCRLVPAIFGIVTLAARRLAWSMRVEVPGTRIGDGRDVPYRLRCVTPLLPPGVSQLSVEVALNGQQFTSEGARYDIREAEAAEANDAKGQPSSFELPASGAWRSAWSLAASVVRSSFLRDEGNELTSQSTPVMRPVGEGQED